jgi:hypothetical protein
MPIDELQGFQNVIDGSVTTKALSTGQINFAELIATGRRISKEEVASESVFMIFDIDNAWTVNESFQMPDVSVHVSTLQQFMTDSRIW